MSAEKGRDMGVASEHSSDRNISNVILPSSPCCGRSFNAGMLVMHMPARQRRKKNKRIYALSDPDPDESVLRRGGRGRLPST